MKSNLTLYLGETAGEGLYIHPQSRDAICLSVISQADFLPLGIQLNKEDIRFITKDDKTIVMDGLTGVKGTVTPETIIMNKSACAMTFLHGKGETTIHADRIAWKQMMDKFKEFLETDKSLSELPLFSGGRTGA